MNREASTGFLEEENGRLRAKKSMPEKDLPEATSTCLGDLILGVGTEDSGRAPTTSAFLDRTRPVALTVQPNASSTHRVNLLRCSATNDVQECVLDIKGRQNRMARH